MTSHPQATTGSSGRGGWRLTRTMSSMWSARAPGRSCVTKIARMRPLRSHCPAPARRTVTVDYATAAGTAAAGSDFVFTSGTLTFVPGETSQTIIVPTINDAVAEYTETFMVALDPDSVVGATIVDGHAVATILDPVTHQSTDVPKDLLDAKTPGRPGVTTSTVNVVASGKISDLNVELDITHTYVGQLAATLIAPDGTRVELFSNVGGGGDDFTATRLDEQAITSITASSAPFTGTFQPEGSLATLDDKDAAGTWTLEIVDIAKGNSGTLNSWALEIAEYEPMANQSPIADADGPYSGTEDLLVTFDAGGSYDPDGMVVSYTWDFGDGTAPVTISQPTITHTYAWGHTFDVTLTVEDDGGGAATDSTTATITEVNDKPVADPGGPYTGVVDVAIHFDGSGSSDFDNEDGTTGNDQTLTYTWDFGDGSDPVTTSEDTISHTYTAIGNHTVQLTVDDGVEASDVQVTQVAVTAVFSTMHVADLDGSSDTVNKRKWAAIVTVLVEDGNGAPVSNATVEGTWSNGMLSAASTDPSGLATLYSGNVDNSVDSVMFTVTHVIHCALLNYDPNANTDPDEPPDSNGTAIVVFRDGTTEPPPGLLAVSAGNVTESTASLTQDVAEAATSRALAVWSQHFSVTMPPEVQVHVADLPAGTLGWAYGETITLDVNADGRVGTRTGTDHRLIESTCSRWSATRSATCWAMVIAT